jgi:hypothetical protein
LSCNAPIVTGLVPPKVMFGVPAEAVIVPATLVNGVAVGKNARLVPSVVRVVPTVRTRPDVTLPKTAVALPLTIDTVPPEAIWRLNTLVVPEDGMLMVAVPDDVGPITFTLKSPL